MTDEETKAWILDTVAQIVTGALQSFERLQQAPLVDLDVLLLVEGQEEIKRELREVHGALVHVRREELKDVRAEMTDRARLAGLTVEVETLKVRIAELERRGRA